MAEQDSKPTPEEANDRPQAIYPQLLFSLILSVRHCLLVGISIILLLAGCSGGGNQSAEAAQETPIVSQTSEAARPAQSDAALTRVASTLAESQEDLPTVTPTPVTVASSQVPLPTVTPTIIPSPVATRTIEIRGDATLRLQLNNESFESSGQPVTIAIEPRTYVLGGDTTWQSDEWCVQLGATGLIFNLTYALLPVSEDLHISGELQLYDGFCGEWGGLGNQLASLPMDLTVPAGSSAQIAPTMQVQGNFLGLPDVLDISTGVALELIIRNPSPR